MLRVFELRELFESVTTLATGMRATGDRLTILTNGGGAGVLAADALEERGGRLAKLSPEALKRLDQVLPATWSHGNPVDLIGDASGERYGRAIEAVLAEPASDAILVMNCPTAVVDSTQAAEAVVAALPADRRTPVLTCWLGEAAAQKARRHFAENKVPTYETPDEAIRAFMHLVDYRRNQELLLETPAAGPDMAPENRLAARKVIDAAIGEGRTVLTEPEAKAVLAAYGVPTVETHVATSPEAAGEAARRIGKPVVLKILSPDITHKSDVGGVRLDLETPAEVAAAAREMLVRVRQHAPDARIGGFSVQEMVQRPQALELLLGMSEDHTFGPVLLFGHGGTAAEVIGDRAVGLPPLNSVLAREMIERTRIARLLRGYRDRPPADMDAIVATLLKLSQLIVDFAEIAELDINPLLADEAGVLALDARIAVRSAAGLPVERLAIRPYPAALAHEAELPGGQRVLIRPIRPEDEPRFREMIRRTSPEDLRLRFFGKLREIPHTLSARLSQIDYSREMALAAFETGERQEMLGVARLIADPEIENAEFAVMVRSDMKGLGLGYRLMNELIGYARGRNLKALSGDVIAANTTMLKMAAELGFERVPTDEPGLARVRIDLTRKA
jgi:acetyltransferase